MPRRVCVRCDEPRNANYFSPRGKVCSICQKQVAKDGALRRKYGITLAEYIAIRAYQGEVCGCCGEGRSYELHVDHDHKLEKLLGVRLSVRGLLCKRCNKLLAYLGDSIPLIRMFINYLEDPPARKVLT